MRSRLDFAKPILFTKLKYQTEGRFRCQKMMPNGIYHST